MVAAEKRTSERLPGPDGPVSTIPFDWGYPATGTTNRVRCGFLPDKPRR